MSKQQTSKQQTTNDRDKMDEELIEGYILRAERDKAVIYAQIKKLEKKINEMQMKLHTKRSQSTKLQKDIDNYKEYLR